MNFFFSSPVVVSHEKSAFDEKFIFTAPTNVNITVMRINFFLTDFCKVAFVCKYYLKSFLCSALLPAPSSFYLPANAQTVGAGARRTRYDITFDRVIVT